MSVLYSELALTVSNKSEDVVEDDWGGEKRSNVENGESGFGEVGLRWAW